MEIYLIRHAIAVDREDPDVQSDSERWLTEEGAKKMQIASRGLSKVVDSLDRIYTSPYRRARETADIVAKNLRAPITELGELQPGVQFNEVAKALQSKNDYRVAIVGHEPDLSEFISESISGTRMSQVLMKKGAAACLQFSSKLAPGLGTLVWLIQPRQLRALDQ